MISNIMRIASLLGVLGLLLISVVVDARSTQKVLVLGDSLSAAYGLPEESGWVTYLSKHFADADIQFVNASISGATTAAGLERLPNLLQQHQPKWVVLELGANDGLQGKPLNYIERNLSFLIERSKAAGSQVLLLGVRLPPNLGRRYTEPFFQLYADLADKYQLHYVPFILEGVAGDRNLMQDDGLHPNAAGQKAIVRSLIEPFEVFLASP